MIQRYHTKCDFSGNKTVLMCYDDDVAKLEAENKRLVELIREASSKMDALIKPLRKLRVKEVCLKFITDWRTKCKKNGIEL